MCRNDCETLSIFTLNLGCRNIENCENVIQCFLKDVSKYNTINYRQKGHGQERKHVIYKDSICSIEVTKLHVLSTLVLNEVFDIFNLSFIYLFIIRTLRTTEYVHCNSKAHSDVFMNSYIKILFPSTKPINLKNQIGFVAYWIALFFSYSFFFLITTTP